MRYIIFANLFLLLLISCSKKKFNITETYVFNSAGFHKGLTIQLLKVYEYDSNGLPKTYKDSLRVDLNYSDYGKIKNKIWLFRDNENYYWTYRLKSKYSTMPIRFEKGEWYGLWSNEFYSGMLKTNFHSFFLYRDSTGRLKVFEKIESLSYP